MADDSVVFSVEELAHYWKVERSTIYTLIKQKRLQAFKCGVSWRITDRAVRAFEEGRQPA